MLSPASIPTSFILAPASALMPPPLLMSSTAICAPFNIRSPCRAHGPENGAITATLTSVVCAVAESGTVAAIATAAPSNRIRNVFIVLLLIVPSFVSYHETLQRVSSFGSEDITLCPLLNPPPLRKGGDIQVSP